MSERIVSIIIISVMLVCFSIPTSFASDSQPDAYSINLLKGLGIGELKNDTAFVTRAEFALVVSDILNRNLSLSVHSDVFSDVKKDNKYAPQIYDLVSRGIISGYSDNSFKPDNVIYYEQAVKILLSALGYDVVCESSGGYPYGYLKVASDKKILSGLSKNVGDSLLPWEAAKLVANALDAQILIQTGFGEQSGYETRENATMITEYMKLDKISGVITDNGITSLTGASRVSPDQIVINGKRYNSRDFDTEGFLGYNTDVYADRESKEVVYAVYGSDNNVSYVDAEALMADSERFSTEAIVYENIYGKTVTANVDIRADFIYNSVVYTDITADDLKISSGRLELVDNNGDGRADVVFVYNAKTVTVSSVSISADKLYSIDGEVYELDSSKNVTIERDGKPAKLSELKQWDTATVYMSRDKQSITVKASSSKLVGKLDSKSDSNGYTVMVNGEFYRVTVEELYELLNPGDEYEFCLDCENNIVAIKSGGSSSLNVGYFVDSKIDSGIDKKLIVRIFTSDGEHADYDCISKINIDGSNERTILDSDVYLQTNAVGKLVEYSLNSSGKITKISLPKWNTRADSGFYGLRMNYDTAGTLAYYSANQRSFAGKVTLGTDAVIFRIPTDAGAYDDYSIEKASYFRNKNGYDFKAYSIGTEDGRADFLVLVADSQARYSNDNTPVTVSRITSVLDENGDERDCLIAYGYRGEVRYLTENHGIFSQRNINPGDVVRCALNLKGQVSDVRKIYDAEQKVIVSSEDASTTYWDSCRSLAGDVWCRYDSLVGITTADTIVSTPEIVAESLEYHNFENVKVYIVDTDIREKVREGSVNDVLGFVNAGADRSRVYMYSYDADPRMLVVYE